MTPACTKSPNALLKSPNSIKKLCESKSHSMRPYVTVLFGRRDRAHLAQGDQ